MTNNKGYDFWEKGKKKDYGGSLNYSWLMVSPSILNRLVAILLLYRNWIWNIIARKSSSKSETKQFP